MEVPHKTNRPHQVRRIWPCMPIPHKTNRILYTLTPEELIHFGPDHRDYKPHPQFVIKFSYHVKRVSGRHRPEIDHEFRERERKTSYEWIQVDNFDSFEDAKMVISPSLSNLGIKEKFHEEIVEKIVECGKSFASRMIEADNGGGIFIPIIVRMLRLKAVWRCKFEGCWAEIGLEEARKSAISELLNEDFPYHVDYDRGYSDDEYDFYFDEEAKEDDHDHDLDLDIDLDLDLDMDADHDHDIDEDDGDGDKKMGD